MKLFFFSLWSFVLPLFSVENYDFSGTHYIASFKECKKGRLEDIEELRGALLQACKASGATVLSFCDHVFPPYGYTCVVLLSESHASIHTYPEYGSCFVDLFTCGTSCSFDPFENVLKTYLEPIESDSKAFGRD